MQHTVTVINGDGIGKEVIPAAISVLEALNVPIRLQKADAGYGTFEATGNALPHETLRRCQDNDAVLFGAT